MPSSAAFRIRFGLVAICSTLVLAFALSTGSAQPGGGITGRPPGGITGRPPGGISGMPGGGVTGRPPGSIGGTPGGGISGMPGGGITGRPPGLPSIPSPPSIGGPGRTVYKWSCGNCKGSLGTTTTPFSPHTKCPFCGVTFTGTTISPGGGIGGGGPPIGPGPGIGAPPPGSGSPRPPRNDDDPPPLPTNPGAGGGSAVAATASEESQPEPAPTNPTPSVSPSDNSPSNESAAEEPKSRRGSRAIVIIGVVLGVLFLAGTLGALAFVVSKANQPVKRTRPRRALDLD
jgi:hypothetical protein